MAEAKIIRALGSVKLLAVFIFILLPTSNGGNLLELKFLDPNKQIWKVKRPKECLWTHGWWNTRVYISLRKF